MLARVCQFLRIYPYTILRCLRTAEYVLLPCGNAYFSGNVDSKFDVWKCRKPNHGTTVFLIHIESAISVLPSKNSAFPAMARLSKDPAFFNVEESIDVENVPNGMCAFDANRRLHDRPILGMNSFFSTLIRLCRFTKIARPHWRTCLPKRRNTILLMLKSKNSSLRVNDEGGIRSFDTVR